MATAIEKNIRFIIADNRTVNQIMGLRGALYVKAAFEYAKVEEPILLNCGEYKGKYRFKWSSSFNEEIPEFVSKEQYNKLIDFLLNSNYNEKQAFNLLFENVEYILSYIDKYDIAYHLENDVAKVEAFIKAVSNTIIDYGATDEELDSDSVCELIDFIKESINLHNTNKNELSNSKMKKLVKSLESGETVEFIYNGLYYEISESSKGNYIVNLYSNDEKDEDDNYQEENLVDGGLCIGSAEDAILFML
ncbi:MAG: hypothetical protein NTW78_05270 [Campylobacterales bacterium]|nr:hypothetical protein [Campylobacterales bacterium]